MAFILAFILLYTIYCVRDWCFHLQIVASVYLEWFFYYISSSTLRVELKLVVNIPIGVIDTNLVSGHIFMPLIGFQLFSDRWLRF